MAWWGSARVHAAFVALAGVLVVLFWTAPGPWISVALASSSALALVALVTTLRRRPVPDPAPWWLVAVAMLVLTGHNLESLRHVVVLGRPVATGIFYELTFPVGYAAMLLSAMLVVFRYARRDAGGVIEAILVAVGAAGVMWAVLLEPALSARDAATGERLYTLVVVLLITGVVGAVVRATLVSPEARGTLVYLLVAVVSSLVGHAGGVLAAEPEAGRSDHWVAMVRTVAYLGLAAAAVHPSLVQLATPGRELVSRLTGRRLVFLGVVLALNPAIAGVQELRGNEVDTPLLLVGSLLVVPLAIARVAGLARLHAATERELARLATRDELTGLPNRRAVDLHLEHAIDRVRSGRAAGVVVLFLDIDDFKLVNDTHGHEAGDLLLAAVARRLRSAVRTADVVARLGGDEFLLVLEGDPDLLRDDAVRRVEAALADPVTLDGVTASARASVGVALVRASDRVTASEVIAQADTAMYVRKRATRATRRA